MSGAPKRTYHSIYGGTEAEVIPPRKTAQNLFDAYRTVRERQHDLAEVCKRIPDYTAQWSSVDYTGDAENALNRAIDAFEDAMVASVQERLRPEKHVHASSGN